MKKQEKGITLIALVITIVILILLAIVSIGTIYRIRIVEQAINGSQKYAEESVKENLIMEKTGDLIENTLYIMDLANKTKITLNNNEIENKQTVTYINIGDSYIIPDNLYSRRGYVLKNWNTKQDGTGDIYTIGDSIEIGYDDIILYAQWELINYTIEYNLGGGTISTNELNKETYNVETESFTLINPTKSGYYFTGWVGSNGTIPQTEVSVIKGDIGDKTYTAQYAQYSVASLRTFSSGDNNVSWTFDSSTGIYTITQRAGSSGWGQGVVCDDSSTNINWGQSYMLEFEIYTPSSYTLKTDGNTMFASTGEGNDIYGTSWLIIDDIREDGVRPGGLPQSHTITGNTWHKVQMYLINNNESENHNHYAIRSFSGFALDLSGVSTNVTYQMRNLKSIVY